MNQEGQASIADGMISRFVHLLIFITETDENVIAGIRLFPT